MARRGRPGASSPDTLSLVVRMCRWRLDGSSLGPRSSYSLWSPKNKTLHICRARGDRCKRHHPEQHRPHEPCSLCRASGPRSNPPQMEPLRLPTGAVQSPGPGNAKRELKVPFVVTIGTHIQNELHRWWFEEIPRFRGLVSSGPCVVLSLPGHRPSSWKSPPSATSQAICYKIS